MGKLTKEEYLKLYKEDALAEICVSLENTCEEYKVEITKALANKATKLNELNAVLNELEQMKETFNSVDKLFEKLKQMPANNFLDLYHRMEYLIDGYVVDSDMCTNATFVPLKEEI